MNSKRDAVPLETPRQHLAAPIWTLLFLAPFIAEVVSGATRLSVLFVLIPEMMVWGGGALLAREMVRRWRAGGPSLLLLGLALSVAEEFVIQQTSIAPLPFPGVNPAYGRSFGVNWIFLLFMLAYESVWVVIVPVQVTELLFPQHRERPWLRARGILVTIVFFLIGSRIAWFGWTQRARKMMGAAPYTPPSGLIAAGLTAIVLLIVLAWLLRGAGHRGRNELRATWSPWIAGIVAFVLGAPWWGLMALIFVPRQSISAQAALVAGVIWAIGSFGLVQVLCAPRGWSPTHRWACCFGAVLSSIVVPDISVVGWTKADLIAKYLFQIIAAVGMLLLRRRVQRESAG